MVDGTQNPQQYPDEKGKNHSGRPQYSSMQESFLNFECDRSPGPIGITEISMGKNIFNKDEILQRKRFIESEIGSNFLEDLLVAIQTCNYFSRISWYGTKDNEHDQGYPQENGNG
jgi:hypothetical protein